MSYRKERVEKLKALHTDEYYAGITNDQTKVCTKCNEVKPLLKFPQLKAQVDGFNNVCRECNTKNRRQCRTNFTIKHNDEWYSKLDLSYEIICGTCKTKKPYTEYHKEPGAAKGFHKVCKECMHSEVRKPSIRKAWDKYYNKNIKEKQKYGREVYYEKKKKQSNWDRLYAYSKRRAHQKGIPFDLTPEYLKSIWNDTCPILNIKLVEGIKHGQEDSPSIDRIIPELGYVKGNVAIISQRANMIKSVGTLEEHEKIVEYIKRATAM